MLARQDIEAHLLRGDPEDLRDAFDLLVDWNGASAIDGLSGAAELMALFERVCAALTDDEGRMSPDAVRALLRGRVGAPPGSVATYGGAARFALAARRSWWPAFSASFPGED